MLRYECAIMQNKLKKTPVIPLFVAGASKDGEKEKLIPFDFKCLDPASFPDTPHKRGNDIQFIVDDMRYFHVLFLLLLFPFFSVVVQHSYLFIVNS